MHYKRKMKDFHKLVSGRLRVLLLLYHPYSFIPDNVHCLADHLDFFEEIGMKCTNCHVRLCLSLAGTDLIIFIIFILRHSISVILSMQRI